MPKINREEYEVLKGLDGRWKWIAVNSKGWLLGFTLMPNKKKGRWSNGKQQMGFFNDKVNGLDRELFRFIQSSDPKPYNVAELIEEYESEEIEVKNNKLNRKTLDKILTEYFDERALSDDDAKVILDYHNFDDETLIELALGVVGLAWGTSGRKVVDILDDFDQLDEPEVLSQEWISEHMYYVEDRDSSMVYASDLQNLLMPKQEELESKIKVLIESYKRVEDAYGELESGWISGFIKDLKNLVEEEPKYYVLDSEDIPLLERWGNKIQRTTTKLSIIYKRSKGDSQFKLTEQEIKDYDPRFWPFAVEVAE